jgi:hypothetical protein
MKGWIIDYQANGGPDYTFRKIMVIIDKDEESAKKIFIEHDEYPNGEDYLLWGFEAMVTEIVEEDPEEYMTGAGWSMSVNSYDYYERVSSNEPSYKDFYFDTEDPSIKDLYDSMVAILPSINDYIKDKIGISSHYKIDDLIESIDLDNGEFEFLLVPGISPVSILKTMIKRGII